MLSAVASWAARSADAIQPDLVSFIASGLKEKEALRRGHLRCLRGICKNADAVLQVSCLIKVYLLLLFGSCRGRCFDASMLKHLRYHLCWVLLSN